MKTIVCIALLAVAASAFNMKEYHQPIIEEVNAKKTTWTAGHNARWESMDHEGLRTQMGVLPTPEWMKLPEYDVLFDENDIPDEFDSRTAWPKCDSIKEVRDQSNCGSCWAFGAAEAMSDRICVASGQTRQDRISTEDLVSCCGFWCGQGCNGGYPEAAWRHFQNTGLVTGDLYGDDSWCRSYSLAPCDHHVSGQYQPCSGDSPTPKCNKKCADKYGKDYKDDVHKGKSAYSVSGVSKIQNEIMTNGPVEASFTVYEDFPTYKSGVYKHTSGGALGGHAIKIIGWGVEDSTPYWTVVNSWNEDWGDKGTFKILRGSNECGIEGGVVAGIPEL